MRTQYALLLLTAMLLLSNFSLLAQNKNDTNAILDLADKYTKGYYLNDNNAMKEVLHPDVFKTTILNITDTNAGLVYASYSIMTNYYAKSDTTGTAKAKEKAATTETEILSIDGQMAMVLLRSEGFSDILHLVKTAKGWQVKNSSWVAEKGSYWYRPLDSVVQAASREMIMKSAKNFINGFGMKRAGLLEAALLPESQFSVLHLKDDGGIWFDISGYSMLVTQMLFAKSDDEEPECEIELLAQVHGVAAVKITTPSTVQYLNIGYFAGTWKVVAVLLMEVE
jgi:hypothetical protein